MDKNYFNVPVWQLGQVVDFDESRKSFQIQARKMSGDKTTVLWEGVVGTIGIDDPNTQIDHEDGFPTNCRFIKAKQGALAGEYAYVALKGYAPPTTGLGPQKWSE